MLDERIVDLARKTAAPQFRDLDKSLTLAAGANRAKLHGNGRLYLVLMELYKQEVGRRAQIIWRNLHRAHGSFGASISADLRSDLVDAFIVDLEAMLAELRPRFDADMKDAPKSAKGPDWSTKLTAARDMELERYGAEIQHYVASLEAAARAGAPAIASYVIHGNVGALMTGAGSVANVVQNINADQRASLLKAVEAVKQTILDALELADRDRNELTEFADEAASELERETPNTRRLVTVLQTLAAAVQGIASAPQAYQVLRAAAAAIGIPV